MSATATNTSKGYKTELTEFEQRLEASKAAENYAPWHPKNVVVHPTRTWRLAFGLMTDAEMEGLLAHMKDSGTAGSKDKPRPKGEEDSWEFVGLLIWQRADKTLRRWITIQALRAAYTI